MRLKTLCTAIWAAALAAAELRTADVYIQPIGAADAPIQLAEIEYDLSCLTTSSIVSYEAPELPETSQLVRIGLYSPSSSKWTSGTTVASVENFSKGYSPHILLSVDSKGNILSAALKGVQIDAGQTRDFGPQVVVLPELKGKQPELNKPVVLSPEGKKPAEEPEKTFLQKYWWVIALVMFVSLSGGGGSEKEG